MIELILAKIWPYLLAVAGLLAGSFALRQSGKSAGKQEIRNEINESQAKARKEARRVEDTNAAMSDDAVDSRLDRWVRNK